MFQIITPQEETYLVTMPTKFRKNIWVKRGNYILIEPIVEGDKVKGEIVRILNKNTIKHFKENNVWPKEFENDEKEADSQENEDIFVNPNRVNVNTYDSDSSDSEDSTDDEHT